jgi:hypothetical protein
MNETGRRAGGRAIDGPETEDWAFTQNPAVRALLDHVAEELAAEFVRLMRSSVAPESEQGSGEEER